MKLYIGLDVSQQRTAICIIDEKGKIVAEGKALTSPAEIYSWIAKRVDLAQVCQAGLEAGAMSFWLHTELAELGLPMILETAVDLRTTQFCSVRSTY